MPREQIFPILSLFLSLGASISYFAQSNVGKGLYWLLGAGITIVVTWVIK
jgi:hypothetical protein